MKHHVCGIYTRDMKPKVAYHALDDIVTYEWRTRTTAYVRVTFHATDGHTAGPLITSDLRFR